MLVQHRSTTVRPIEQVDLEEFLEEFLEENSRLTMMVNHLLKIKIYFFFV